jgi:hypothetical protein
MSRRTRWSTWSGAVVALLVAGTLAAPSAAAGGDGSRKCKGPPVTMRIESGDVPTGADLEVTDGVARRVPILTGREQPGTTPRELEKLEREAAKSKLAMYQIFLADFRIARKELTGPFSSAFYTPTVKAGETAAVLAIVPRRARGLREGDIISAVDRQEFESVTTFAPVSLQVVTGDDDPGFGTATGKVEVVALDRDSICVAVDFTITDLDEQVAAALEGVVEVPVVTSKNKSLYFF